MWVTFSALAIAAMIVVIMQSMVVPILPSLAVEYDVSVTDASWVLTVNLLAAAVFTPLLSRLGDAWGKKRVMAGTLAAVLAGSLLAVLEDSFASLLVGRVLQGAGFAVIPLAIALVRDIERPERVPGRISLLSAIMGIGGGAGLVVAGLLSEAGAGPVDMFWVIAGAAAVGFAAVLALVPESHERASISFDLVGILTLAGWLVAGLLGVDRVVDHGWDDGVTLGLFGGAVVLLAAWIAWEARHPDPMVDMRMLRKPVVLGTNISGLLIGLGMFGAFVLITQYVQTPSEVGYGFSASILEAGLTLLPLTAGTIVAAVLTSLLIARTGPKVPFAIGPLLAGLTFAGMAVWHDEMWHFAVGAGVLGLGVGLAMGSMPALINSAVPTSQTGVANGMNSTFREVGGSIGSAMIAALLASEVLPGIGLPTEGSYETSFVVAACLCVAAAVAAAVVPYRHRRTADADVVLGEVADEQVGTESVDTGRHRQRLAVGGLVHRHGTPLVGAALTLTDLSGRQLDRTRTDEAGRYALTPPGQGTFLLVCSATPAANGSAPPEPHAELVTVTGTVEHDIALSGAQSSDVSLAGTVRSTSGPVAGATVTVLDESGQVQGVTITDRAGGYALTGLPAGALTLTAVGPEPVTVAVRTTGVDTEHDLLLGDAPVSHPTNSRTAPLPTGVNG